MIKWAKEVWDEYYEFFVFFGVLIAGVALLVGVLMTGDYYWSKHTCNEKADQMGLQSDYGFWSDCMVRFDSSDPWVPLDSVRVVAGQLYTDKDSNE